MDARPTSPGFIRRLYAPRDPAAIDPSDRVFYTPENADRLDSYRRLIQDEPPRLRSLLMGPLLSAASIHANTAGVFKGFYKDQSTGIGKFGGSGADALDRIRVLLKQSQRQLLLGRLENRLRGRIHGRALPWQPGSRSTDAMLTSPPDGLLVPRQPPGQSLDRGLAASSRLDSHIKGNGRCSRLRAECGPSS